MKQGSGALPGQIKTVKPTTCAAGLILIILAMLPGTGCGSSEMKLPEGGVVKLRAEYKALSESDVKSLLKNRGFFDRRWNRTGGFPNRFKSQTVNDEKIVADLATNLTWHQSGSQLPITLEDAETWLKELNDKKYAGYSGWRLPTLEEALSLLERKAVDRYHIDPLFSRLQYSMWTGDIYSEIRAWGISFNYGRVFKARFNEGDFVRPVRTGVPKK